MPRPSMIPTARGKIINVVLWAEREGYMHVAAALRTALALLPAEEIPPHPAPPEIREAVADEIEAEGYPLIRSALTVRRGAPPHRCVIWENWEALDNIRRGRIIKHIPTDCVFAVECQGRGFEDWEARLEEGPEVADIEEIGREAIGYFMAVGQSPLPPRFARPLSPPGGRAARSSFREHRISRPEPAPKRLPEPVEIDPRRRINLMRNSPCDDRRPHPPARRRSQ